MKKCLLFLFFAVVSEYLIAQTDFRPGYIIQNNGDTAFGEIDYRGDLLMGNICRFRQTPASPISNFYPNDIAAYRFTDSKYFVSRTVNGKMVFLEYLINGKASIYYLRDDIGDHYFIESDSLRFSEIPYEEGIRYEGNKEYFYRSHKHIGVLTIAMQDAPAFQKEIARIKQPNHQNLIKLAEDYHYSVCKDGACIIYEKKLPLIQVSIEPAWGLARYNGLNKMFNEYGCSFFLWAPRANEKVYIKIAYFHSNIKDEGEQLNISKIPFQVQYIYPGRIVQPKAGIGVTVFWYNEDKYSVMFNTLSCNTGVNIRLYKSLFLSTTVNMEFTPILAVIANDMTIDWVCGSLYMGLHYKF